MFQENFNSNPNKIPIIVETMLVEELVHLAHPCLKKRTQIMINLSNSSSLLSRKSREVTLSIKKSLN